MKTVKVVMVGIILLFSAFSLLPCVAESEPLLIHNPHDRYSVSVDYSKTMREWIYGSNPFRWHSAVVLEWEIVEGGPDPSVKDTENIDVYLFENTRTASREEIIRQLKNQGYRPATVNELLFLFSRYSFPHRRYPFSRTSYSPGERYRGYVSISEFQGIAALGTVWAHPSDGTLRGVDMRWREKTYCDPIFDWTRGRKIYIDHPWGSGWFLALCNSIRPWEAGWWFAAVPAN